MAIRMNADPSCLLRNLDDAISSGDPDSLHMAANIVRAQLRAVRTTPDTSIKVGNTETEVLQEVTESISHNELLDSYIICQDDERYAILRKELARRLNIVSLR